MAAAALALAFLAANSPAIAVTDEERAGAREAATEGSRAFEEGRFAEAIDLFTRAESLVHSPVHLLYVARAQAQLGNLVKARETYLKILREPLEPDAPSVFTKAVESATSESQAIDGRIPRANVSVDGPGAGEATVSIDGKAVPNALIGVPHPVNPGKHTLQASAPGMRSDPVEATFAEGERKSIVLVLEPNSAGAPAAATPAPAPQGAPRTVDPARDATVADTEDAAGPSGLRMGSYVAFGVGALGLGAGALFGLNANSKADDRDALFDACDPECAPSEQDEIVDLNDQATSAATLSTVGWVVGGVGVAAGVTLLILSLNADPGASQAAPVRITPWVGLRSAGVAGTF